MKYNVTIGMEVHAELKTDSKMFCACKNGLGLEKEPNVHICPVCTAQPGSLPVPNRKAIEAVQRVGLSLGCMLRLRSKFDRKNYFYPDIPKGYQISQYDEPFCEKGEMEILEGKTAKKFRITRIHLEEDTGKSMHPAGTDYTLVDFNRAGVPLMELVTEADFSTGKEARLFCQKLRQILRYLEVSDADMEKGQMRCEVNISLYPEGTERLSGTKVEVKNINSFRFVERAIEYEIKRQTEALEKGEKIVQETRGWDEVKNVTVSQRKKESAHDYRYFPGPDIPPFEFTEAYVEQLRASLPELPDAKLKRFIAESGKEVADIAITPENYAEFIGIVADGKINSSAAQTVLSEMYQGGDNDPSHIIERLNLAQVSDISAIEEAVDMVLAANKKSVADYKAGKQNAFQYLIGQIMKETKGKANPEIVIELLKKKLAHVKL